jgi:hypothetical protein
MKQKILALTLVLVLAFGSVALAAKSSSKSFSPSRPSTGSTVKPTTPQAAPDTGYKPTAPSSSYSNTAPAAQTKPGAAQPAPQQQQNSFWRSAGMFGGGMLMGSMLGSMFGFGNSGFMASLFGMLFNVLILAAIFMAGRWLWNRFKDKDKDKRRNF